MDYLSVIIVAGGIGQRMGRSVPKQFLLLGNRPILMHTIEQFYQAFAHLNLRIILVMNPNYVEYWQELVEKYAYNIPHLIVNGGKERFHSVRNGLEKTWNRGLVAIHDAVRPLVTTCFLKMLYEEAQMHGNAVPFVLPHSSIRIEKDGQNWPIDRSTVRLIQTPQIFEVALLRKAYLQDYDPSFTDDATVYETIGQKIHLVPGLEENIKITKPIDLYVAEELLTRQNK